jgi:hypothetical protein
MKQSFTCRQLGIVDELQAPEGIQNGPAFVGRATGDIGDGDGDVNGDDYEDGNDGTCL